MRLRFRGVDYCEAAARKCHEKYIRSLLLVPNLPYLCEGLNVEWSQLLKSCTECSLLGNLETDVSLEITFAGRTLSGSDVKAQFLSSILPFKETLPCSYKPGSTISENLIVQQKIANFDALEKHESSIQFFEENLKKSQRKNANASSKPDSPPEEFTDAPLLNIESMLVDWAEQECPLHLHILLLNYNTWSPEDDKLQLLSLKEKLALHPAKIQLLWPNEHGKVGNLQEASDAMSLTTETAPDPFCNTLSEISKKEILSHTPVSEKFRSLIFVEAYEMWIYYDLTLLEDALPLFPLTPMSLLEMHSGFQGRIKSSIQMSEMLPNLFVDEDTSTTITIDSWNIFSRKCTLKQDQDHSELLPASWYYEVLMTLLKCDDYVSLSHSLPVDNWDLSEGAYTCSTSLTDLEHKVPFFEVLQIFEDDVLCMWSPEFLLSNKYLGPVSLEVSVEQAPARSFEILIVRPQLKMDCSKFQTLLVPLLSECNEEWGLGPLILETVSVRCKNFVVPGSDWLYLDWHLIEGRDCSNNVCFNLRKKLREQEEEQWTHIKVLFTTKSELPIHSGLNMLDEQDAVPITAASNDSHELRYDSEAKELDPSEKFTVTGKPDLPAENTVLNFKGLIMEDNLKLPRDGRVMNCTMSNDLTFFIQARKGSGKSLLADSGQNDSLKGDCHAAGIAGPNLQNNVLPENHTILSQKEKSQCTIHIHEVELSVEIVKIMQQIGADYIMILEREEGLVLASDLEVPRRLTFESMGHVVLMSVITAEALKQKTEKRQQLLKVLIALYVLWQTALNLHDYGVQVAHLYLENLLHSLEFLDVWLHNSRVKLEEAFMMVENGQWENHPKLKMLEIILRNLISRSPNNEEQHKPKICVLGQRRAYFTLYKTLGSVSLKVYEIDREQTLFCNHQGQTSEVEQSIVDALGFANCLLMPPKYINSCFPIEKFTVFILYAQSFGTNEDGHAAEEFLKASRCQLHVLQVKKECVPGPDAFKHLKYSTDEHGCQLHSTPKVIIEPIASLKNGKRTSTMGSLPNTTKNSVLRSTPRQKGDQLKWSIPTSRDLESIPQPSIQEDSFVKHLSGVPDQKPPVPLAHVIKKRTATEAFIQEYQHARSVSKLTRNHQNNEQQCACIIVANIVLSGGFILSARRSSYQNILSLEKKGAQVVERELRLPVDLILSPATCLVLYTDEKFKCYTDNLNSGTTSSSPSLEYIIDNHLKAISFSFKSCILIFEGPNDFTTSILADIDDVYAAAVGLNICLQCFISDRAETTDTIILDCIQIVQRSNDKKSFPLMAESRTLVEAFLCEFPSVNPLTAHAIVCSGVPLPTFMSLTHDEQLSATKAFDLPEHSMMLFSIQCQYGKKIKCDIGSSHHILHSSSEDKSLVSNAVEHIEAVIFKAKMDMDQTNQSMTDEHPLHASDGIEGLHQWSIKNNALPYDMNPLHGLPSLDGCRRANKTYEPHNIVSQLTDSSNFVGSTCHRSDANYRELDEGKYSTRSGSRGPNYQPMSCLLTDNTHERHPSYKQQQSALRPAVLEDHGREPLEAPPWKLCYLDKVDDHIELSPSYTGSRANPLEGKYQKFATVFNDDVDGKIIHSPQQISPIRSTFLEDDAKESCDPENWKIHYSEMNDTDEMGMRLPQQFSAIKSTFLEDHAKESCDPQSWKLHYPEMNNDELRDTPSYLPFPREMNHDIHSAWGNQFLDFDLKCHPSGLISGQQTERDLEEICAVRNPQSTSKAGVDMVETGQLGSVQAVLKDWLHSQEKARPVSLGGQQSYKLLTATHQKLKQQPPVDSLMANQFSQHSIPRHRNLRTPHMHHPKSVKKLDPSMWRNYSYKSTPPIANLSTKNISMQSSLGAAPSQPSSFKILSAVKTPEDKKASQSLTYVKVGNDKQSRLIWSPMRPKIPQIRKKARPDAAYTL